MKYKLWKASSEPIHFHPLGLELGFICDEYA